MDPNQDPALFFSGFPRCQQKDFLKMFVKILLTIGTLTSVFKDKNILRTPNQSFSLCFCLLMEGSDGIRSTQIITNPDPEHCQAAIKGL
jgi:hypothetical protein